MKLFEERTIGAEDSVNVLPRWRASESAEVSAASEDDQGVVNAEPTTTVVGRSMGTVMVLAFCQSMIFLALLLFWCVLAGAAETGDGKGELAERLKPSVYQPTVERDPFYVGGPRTVSKVDEATPVVVSQIPGKAAMVAVPFELQGTLFQSENSTAIINGTLVSLNKTVTLTAGNRAFKARITEITRERVKLEIRGERVELRLDRPQMTVELPETVFE